MALSGGGTLSIFDTSLASRGIVEYGLDNAYEQVKAVLDAHNAQVNGMLGELCEDSPDYLRSYGGDSGIVMQTIEEFGAAEGQKIVERVNIGFPLEHFEVSLQHTREYLQHATLGDLSKDVNGALDADLRNTRYLIQTAVFNDDNATWVDRRDRSLGLSLPLKAWYNADSGPVAVGPNGESFDGATHTHFIANTSVTNANLQALLDKVAEHGTLGGQGLRLYINIAHEATVRGFADFVAHIGVDLIKSPMDINTPTALTYTNRYDRSIGQFQGAEVWVKSWMPANYLFAFNVLGMDKPLLRRIPKIGNGDLRIIGESDMFPLHAKVWGRDIGISVWNRANGAVWYTASGSYAEPTLSRA